MTNETFYVAKVTTATSDYFEVSNDLDDLIKEIRGFDKVKFVHAYNIAEGWSRDHSEAAARCWLRLDTEKYGGVSLAHMPEFVRDNLPDDDLSAYCRGADWGPYGRTKPNPSMPIPKAKTLEQIGAERIKQAALDSKIHLEYVAKDFHIAYYMQQYSDHSCLSHFADGLTHLQTANQILKDCGVQILGVENQVEPTADDHDNDN